jgi:glycosyltransferase involved in cell wall biosynthesis
MSPPQRIAFIKTGSFSHSNQQVLRLLQRQFPDAAIDVIETGGNRLSLCNSLPFMAALALAHYGPKACRTVSAIRKHALRTPAYFDAIGAAIARRLAGRPYLFTFQTQSMIDGSQPGIPHFVYTDHTHLTNLYYPGVTREDLGSPAWIEKERSIYANARVTFTMASHVGRSLHEHYGIDESRIQCVRAGANVETSEISALDDRRYASKNILFVGIDWERKGGPQLLRAFEQVLIRHPGATLTIVGSSPTVSTRGCQVIGLVPPEVVAEYYRRAAIFCMPTRNEPLGMVFMEAFEHRLPIVATTIGAIPDLIQDGVSGYLVDPDDVDALARRLDELLSAPAKCRAMGHAGFEHVRAHYTWERTGQLIGERIRRELALDGADGRNRQLLLASR